MSRRESDSKRHRSSPKRSRRDGKPETERIISNDNLDTEERTERDQKHRRRLQDALPLEAPAEPDFKVDTGVAKRESEKKIDESREGRKHSSDPTGAPRSRSFFQHDERGNAGQVGRKFSRRDANVSDKDRGWWRDSKDQYGERSTNKATPNDPTTKDNKPQAQGSEDRAWRHDGFLETEANPTPPSRRRPAFREKKVATESENPEKIAKETGQPSDPDRPMLGSKRREERGGRNTRYLDRTERPFSGDKVPSNRESEKGTFPVRERNGGGFRGRERERFGGRQGYGGYHLSGGGRVEKWKHDLFEEANQNPNPNPKNEEDQIAKVEALLAS